MNRSEQINELASALAKVKFGQIKRDKTVRVTSKRTGQTYTFSYAPLETILTAIRGPLSDQGLVLSQDVVYTDGKPTGVETLLMHSSGQWRSCNVPIIIDNAGMQELGSVISYARRYGVTLVTCTVADEDDDANIAEGNTVTKALAPQPPVRAGDFEKLSPSEQAKVLDASIEVVDAWTAGDLDSAYKLHRTHEKALREIGAEAGSALWDQYEPKLRSALTKRHKEAKEAYEKQKALLGSQA